MARTKTKHKANAAYRVVKQNAVPLDALLEPWEMIDWAAIDAKIMAGNSVHIASASGHDERHSVGCALRELGRLHVHVQYCYLSYDDVETYGLWIIPRGAVKNVLLDPFERVEV